MNTRKEKGNMLPSMTKWKPSGFPTGRPHLSEGMKMCSLKNVGAALLPSKLLLQSLIRDSGVTVTQTCRGHAVHPWMASALRTRPPPYHQRQLLEAQQRTSIHKSHPRTVSSTGEQKYRQTNPNPGWGCTSLQGEQLHSSSTCSSSSTGWA